MSGKRFHLNAITLKGLHAEKGRDDGDDDGEAHSWNPVYLQPLRGHASCHGGSTQPSHCVAGAAVFCCRARLGSSRRTLGRASSCRSVTREIVPTRAVKEGKYGTIAQQLRESKWLWMSEAEERRVHTSTGQTRVDLKMMNSDLWGNANCFSKLLSLPRGYVSRSFRLTLYINAAVIWCF